MQWPTERMSQTCGIFSGGHCNTVWYILHCVKWVGWKCGWNGKGSLKKGGATLIRPSSTNFTAVFLHFLSKGMKIRFYSSKLEKWRKIRKRRHCFAHLALIKEREKKRTTLLCSSISNKSTRLLFWLYFHLFSPV